MNMQQSIQNSISQTERTLRQEFKDGLEAVVASNVELRKDVTAIEVRSKQNERDIINLRSDLAACRRQMTEHAGVTVKHDQKIAECDNQLKYLTKHVNKDMIRISGLKEKQGESAKAAVDNFFKILLKIETPIGLWDAYRVGKGDYKTIIFQLKNFRDKGLIYGNIKNLKDVTNDRDQPYQVKDHLSPKDFALQKKLRQLHTTNKKSTISKLKMSFEKAKLKVDGEVYTPEIRPPTCREILIPSTTELTEHLKVTVVPGEPVTVENQVFQGYTAVVKSTAEVNAAYARVATLHTEARHCIGVCRIPGERWHILQDFNDDDEHGLGAVLLHMLSVCKIYNRAVFVTRTYDGQHICNKRVDAIQRAAESAILNAPFNKATGLHQFPWPQNGTDSGSV